MADCNHPIIRFRPIELPSGMFRDRWACETCRAEFARKINLEELTNEITDETFGKKVWEIDMAWDEVWNNIYDGVMRYIRKEEQKERE